MRKNVVGMVNLKPLAPGHVLVCSRRKAKRIKDLNEIETLDLWVTAQEVQKVIEDIYKTTCSVVIQDGVEAGQTVEHAHIHIFPKFKDNDLKIAESEARQPRDEADMTEEAKKYREFFEQNEQSLY